MKLKLMPWHELLELSVLGGAVDRATAMETKKLGCSCSAPRNSEEERRSRGGGGGGGGGSIGPGV